MPARKQTIKLTALFLRLSSALGRIGSAHTF